MVDLFRPVTKWALEVHDHNRVPELVARAAHATTAGRRRPVMVSLPLDVQIRELPEPAFREDFEVPLPRPAPESLDRAAEVLSRAQRPLILVGGGAEHAGAQAAVARLAEALDAPVAGTWLRKSAFPDTHGAFIGCLGFGALPVTETAFREADVVLALGARFAQFTTRRYTLPSPDCAVIQVDVDPRSSAACTRRSSRCWATPGTPRRGSRTASRAARSAVGAWPGCARTTSRSRCCPRRPTPQHGVSSAAVVSALARARDAHDPIIVSDAPTFAGWMQRYLRVTRPGSFLGNAGGAMGWGLPAALGVKLARPDEQVVCVSGDGSFWMVAQDLETAVREDIPVVVVITNNFAYGNTRDRQRTAHGGRYIGVHYDNPDFAAYAELCGALGIRVERDEDVGDAIDRAIRSGRPAVVDVIQDRDEGLPPGVLPPGRS